MRQEKPESSDGLPGVRSRETRQRRANAQEEALRRRMLGWLVVEVILAAIVFAAIVSMAGCVIVQSVPDRAGAAPSAPVARIILEQRQAAPAERPDLPPK